MSAAGDNLKEKSAFVWRKNSAKERTTMQNKRRKRKRKARSAKKENQKKRVLALENEKLRTTRSLMAKNEQFPYLARKYYAKWKTLHRVEQVGKSFNVYVILSNLFKVYTRPTNFERF